MLRQTRRTKLTVWLHWLDKKNFSRLGNLSPYLIKGSTVTTIGYDTVVNLKTKFGEIRGYALLSEKDTYDIARGFNVALGRALKEFEFRKNVLTQTDAIPERALTATEVLRRAALSEQERRKSWPGHPSYEENWREDMGYNK